MAVPAEDLPFASAEGALAPGRSGGRLSRVSRSLDHAPPKRSLLTPGLHWGVSPYLSISDALGAGVVAAVGGISLGQSFAMWVLTVVLLTHRGAYRSRLNKSVLDQLPTLLASPLFAVAIVACCSAFVSPPRGNVGNVLLAGILYAALLIAGRLICNATVRKVREAGLVAHRTLVIGAGRVSRDITHSLQSRPGLGLLPVAVWDVDPLLTADEFGGVPLIRDTSDLAGLISTVSAKVVIIAFGRHRESEMVSVVRTCDRMDCEIFVVPRLFELHQRDPEMEEVWGMPLVRLRRPAYRLPTWRLKRVMDVVAATALLIPLSPLMLILALAVRLEGGTGVIFRQQRVGLDGRTFELMKFRTLRSVGEAESAASWSLAQEVRVGSIGKFLRRSSLDELPQLWNVLRGDMTLVGPRPERPYFVEQFSREFPRYLARHRVPAGLTGWAQIHGLRGDTSIRERALFDNYYIENWSLWLDVKILLRTALAVLRREGG